MLERFELVVLCKGKGEWKQLVSTEGPAKALKAIQSEQIQLTPGLDASVRVISQAGLLEGLGETVSESETPDSVVKKLMTVRSLEIEEIKSFFPELMPKLEKFQAAARKWVMDYLGGVEETIRIGKGTVDKFRPLFQTGCII